MTNSPHVVFHLVCSDDDLLEQAAAVLMAEGCEGVVDTPDGADAFAPLEGTDLAAMRDLLAMLGMAYTEQTVEPANWNAVWEASYAPVRVSTELLIRAPFHRDEAEAKIVIELEPKMSFGTGHHETTRLMCSMLLHMQLADCNVIDMGCGTGVLGILALKLGAANVVGIDVDEWAIENTRENIARNHVEEAFEVLLGDARKLAHLPCQVLLANINRNILLADMQAYAQSVLPGGALLVSGFFVEDAPAIQEAARLAGFGFAEQHTENRWAALRFVRNHKPESEHHA